MLLKAALTLASVTGTGELIKELTAGVTRTCSMFKFCAIGAETEGTSGAKVLTWLIWVVI